MLTLSFLIGNIFTSDEIKSHFAEVVNILKTKESENFFISEDNVTFRSAIGENKYLYIRASFQSKILIGENTLDCEFAYIIDESGSIKYYLIESNTSKDIRFSKSYKDSNEWNLEVLDAWNKFQLKKKVDSI